MGDLLTAIRKYIDLLETNVLYMFSGWFNINDVEILRADIVLTDRCIHVKLYRYLFTRTAFKLNYLVEISVLKWNILFVESLKVDILFQITIQICVFRSLNGCMFVYQKVKTDASIIDKECIQFSLHYSMNVYQKVKTDASIIDKECIQFSLHYCMTVCQKVKTDASITD